MYILTKSRITTGLKCKKRLWFDINDPIKKDSYLFHLGNRFGDFAKTYYGPGVDLTGNLNAADVIKKTTKAIEDKSVTVIYEGAFLFDETLVRTDVLVRRGTKWELIEVKSSSNLKDAHIIDAAAQAYIVERNNVKLISIKIAHINDSFEYLHEDDYEGLLLEVDITQQAKAEALMTKDWIKELLPIATKGAPPPNIQMGDQCGTGSTKCIYFERCELPTKPSVEVPISILPNVGKRMSEKWAQNGIYDLRELPLEAFSKPNHRIIQQAHIDNKDWVSTELVNQIRDFQWPRYFMDFETVQQGVPRVRGTKPRDRLAFQWSVHCWASPTQELELRGNREFLEFTGEGLERRFLLSLLACLGNEGPIFAHNADFERGMLVELSNKEGCQDLKPKIEAVLDRLVCTLKMTRAGFYSPRMNGSYSLKNIVKAIPRSVEYKSLDDEGLEVSNGGDAMIAWFECTDWRTKKAMKEELTENLKAYCAKDTYALYQLFKYLSNT